MSISNRLIFFLIIIGTHPVFAQDNLQSVKSYIYGKHPSLQHNKAMDWVITDEVYNKRNGVTHLYLRQTYGGVEIFNANSNAVIRNGKVHRLTGRIVETVSSGNQSIAPSINAEQAIRQAAHTLGLEVTETLQPLPASSVAKSNTKAEEVYSSGGISIEPIPVKKVFLIDRQGKLKLCWDLSIYEVSQENWWSMRIDAATGEVVEKHNWVTKCTFDPSSFSGNSVASHPATHHHLEPASEEGGYRVFPLPLENPNDGASTFETNPFDVTASPWGWHDTNGETGADYTITRGNNVHAYEDMANMNEPGYSPGSESLTFDYSYSVDNEMLPNRDAAITNLFYANNKIHDIMYHYGFDEESGNFQANNYGKGGAGEDYVRAEAQDGSGQDNANFATPPDGFRPRMQMFMWNPIPPDVIVESPAEIAGAFKRGVALFGPTITSVIRGELALGSANASTESCTAITSNVAGKIAVIDRGTCTFEMKVKNAQEAGAIAVIIVDNLVADFPPTLGDDITMTGPITIPAISIIKADGEKVRAAITAGETVTISISPYTQRDASVDNGIVIHEYGHGISNRLTGGPSNVACLTNNEQMGEGWSDYFAMMLTMKAGQSGEDARGIAAFSIGEPLHGGGIRPAPYSTNMAVNNFTYDHVKEFRGQPHAIGFIWCEMLWEMSWKFISRYGFDPDIVNGNGGNNIALQLVIDALKLQPCGPGFVDGRDAILLADQLNNNGANQDIIWEAFAKRGLGASADQGDPDSATDGIAAFDMPHDAEIMIRADKGFASGSDIVYTIAVKNTSLGSITSLSVADVLPDGIVYVDGSATEGGIFTNGALSFENLALESGEEKIFTFHASPSSEVSTHTRFRDDAENGMTHWNAVGVRGNNSWHITSGKSKNGAASFYTQSIDAKSDQIMILKTPVAIGPQTKLAFNHLFYTETEFDGGVVEISTNGGLQWQDLKTKFITGGYNSIINGDADSPLAGRQAFSGYQKDFQKTVIDLASFAGNDCLIRFRSVTDAVKARDGWYIDDLYFYDGDDVVVTNEACFQLAENAPSCATTSLVLINMLPTVLNHIADQRVTQYTEFDFAFDDAMFNDPEGSTLTYSASLSSGEPLPSWITFDAASRSFSGRPDAGAKDISVYITATDVQGGSISDEFLVVVDLVTAAEQDASKVIAMYPNPTLGTVTLTLHERAGKLVYTIRNVLGQEIVAPKETDHESVQIDLSNLPAGPYIVEVNDGRNLFQTQLIKQ